MKNKLPDPAWFTFSELADRWCVSIETVTRYIKCGMLKHSDPPGTSGPMAGYRVMLAGHDGHNLHLYNPRDVIYLEEVLRFEAEHKIGQRQVKAKQRDPDNPKSKNTLLQIIAVMAIKGYKYNPNDQRSTVPATIVNSAQSMGITLDQKTVREWLQQAAECIPPE